MSWTAKKHNKKWPTAYERQYDSLVFKINEWNGDIYDDGQKHHHHGWQCACWRCDYSCDGEMFVTGNSTHDFFIHTLHKLKFKAAKHVLCKSRWWCWNI